MVNLNINIQKKDLWLLSAIVVFLVGVGFIIAYNPGWETNPGDPAVHGHTPDEIEGFGGMEFGVWTETGTLASGGSETIVNGHVYVAETNGFVVAWGGASASIIDMNGYTDGNNPPTTIRLGDARTPFTRPAWTMPVRKGDYWKTSGAETVYWIPIISG